MVMQRDHGRSNGHRAHGENRPPKVDYPRLLELGRDLLIALGENPEREGWFSDHRECDHRSYRIRWCGWTGCSQWSVRSDDSQPCPGTATPARH